MCILMLDAISVYQSSEVVTAISKLSVWASYNSINLVKLMLKLAGTTCRAQDCDVGVNMPF